MSSEIDPEENCRSCTIVQTSDGDKTFSSFNNPCKPLSFYYCSRSLTKCDPTKQFACGRQERCEKTYPGCGEMCVPKCVVPTKWFNEDEQIPEEADQCFSGASGSIGNECKPTKN